MPTLIRLFIFLVILAGLALGGMVALTTLVNPESKDITIRIPPRDLLTGPSPDAPIDLNDLPAPVNIAPALSSSEPSASDDSSVLEVEPGAPE